MYIKKIIKKFNVTYYDIFLGGVFGIFRGIMLVYCILYLLNYITLEYYNYYINHSILILFFLKIYHNF